MSRRFTTLRLLFAPLIVITYWMFPSLPFIAAQPIQRCGTETDIDLSGVFWFTEVNNHTITIEQISIIDGSNQQTEPRLATQMGIKVTFPFDRISVGNGIAVLAQSFGAERRDAEKELYLFDLEQQLSMIPKAPIHNGLHWWRLLSEREDGHFGILGYDNESNMFIVDINRSAGDVLISNPDFLPFKFNPMQFYWMMLSVSPDHEFIGYIQESGSDGLEILIYSRSQKQPIFRTTYADGGFTNVIWTPGTKFVGLISGTTQEATDQLIGIKSSGETTLLADLSTIYPEEATVIGLSGFALEDGQVAFVAHTGEAISSEPYRLLLLDLETRELIDICYSTASVPLILGASGANLIVGNVDTRSLSVISTADGNFGEIHLGEMNRLPTLFTEAVETVD
jgi:hypothetical protein